MALGVDERGLLAGPAHRPDSLIRPARAGPAGRRSRVRSGFSGKVGSSLMPLGHTGSSASPPVAVPATSSVRAMRASVSSPSAAQGA